MSDVNISGMRLFGENYKIEGIEEFYCPMCNREITDGMLSFSNCHVNEFSCETIRSYSVTCECGWVIVIEKITKPFDHIVITMTPNASH